MNENRAQTSQSLKMVEGQQLLYMPVQQAFFECSHSRNYYKKATRQLWVGRKTPRQKIDETDKKPTGTGFILSQSKIAIMCSGCHKICSGYCNNVYIVVAIMWQSIVVAKYVSFHCKRRNGTRSCNIR